MTTAATPHAPAVAPPPAVLAPLQQLAVSDLLTPAMLIAAYDAIRHQLEPGVAARMGAIDVDTLRYYRRRTVGVLSPPQTPQGHLTRQHLEELLIIRLGAAVRRWTLETLRQQLAQTPDRAALVAQLVREATPVRPLPRAHCTAPAQPVTPAPQVPVRPLALPPVQPRRVQLPHGLVVEIPADAPVFQPGPERRAVLRALAAALRPAPRGPDPDAPAT